MLHNGSDNGNGVVVEDPVAGATPSPRPLFVVDVILHWLAYIREDTRVGSIAIQYKGNRGSQYIWRGRDRRATSHIIHQPFRANSLTALHAKIPLENLWLASRSRVAASR